MRIAFKEGQDTAMQPREELENIFYPLNREFIFLFLLITERQAAKRVMHDKQKELSDNLLKTCVEMLADIVRQNWPADLVERMKAECQSKYAAFVSEHAKHPRLLVPGNENPKDTLLWEFGKSLHDACGVRHNILNLTLCIEIIVNALKALDIPKFVSRVE